MSGNVEEACWDECGAYPNVENLNAIYTALKDPSQIEFTYIAPSPIRKEETMVVHRNFIDGEMKELGLTCEISKHLSLNLNNLIIYNEYN